MAEYSIKQVATLTSVPATTLRAWERRYGVVSPERTQSRYRRYSDADVQRLRHMARMIAAGTPASLAAQQIGGLDKADPTVGSPPAPPVPDFVAAAGALDQSGLDSILARAFASGRFEDVVESWLLPAMRQVGDGWHQGDLDVAGEHLATGAATRYLATQFRESTVEEGAPIVLAGLPAGAHHHLGTLAFAVCLRRQGVDVRYLGENVPTQSWLRAVADARPQACVVGIPMLTDAPAALDLLTNIDPATPVFVGGSGVDAVALPDGAIALERISRASAARVADHLHA